MVHKRTEWAMLMTIRTSGYLVILDNSEKPYYSLRWRERDAPDKLRNCITEAGTPAAALPKNWVVV